MHWVHKNPLQFGAIEIFDGVEVQSKAIGIELDSQECRTPVVEQRACWPARSVLHPACSLGGAWAGVDDFGYHMRVLA